ncbi:hypothetical protein EBQ91_06580 [bacterium]|nr:hypothetical protein [bacterium]
MCFTYAWSLDVLITEAQQHKTSFLVAMTHQNKHENLVTDKLIKNFEILDTIQTIKAPGPLKEISYYRRNKIDFLVAITVDEKKLPYCVDIQLISPWGASLETERKQWPVMLSKKFEFHTEKDLQQITNQITDDIINRALCLQGFASYPIAYVYKKDKTKIVISDITGDLKTNLYECHYPILGLTWSPDGSKLAFIEVQDNGPVLKTVDRYKKIIQEHVRDMYVASPLFSNDSQSLYYVAAPYSVGQIFKKNLVTNNIEMLTVGQDWIIDINEGSDSYNLLVTADRIGTAQLYEFNILNKRFKRLTFNEDQCSKGFLSLKNKALFYTVTTPAQTVLVKRSLTDKSFDSTLVMSDHYAEGVTMPETQGIAVFEKTAQGQSVIIIKSMNSGLERVLFDQDGGGEYSSPSWASQPGF